MFESIIQQKLIAAIYEDLGHDTDGLEAVRLLLPMNGFVLLNGFGAIFEGGGVQAVGKDWPDIPASYAELRLTQWAEKWENLIIEFGLDTLRDSDARLQKSFELTDHLNEFQNFLFARECEFYAAVIDYCYERSAHLPAFRSAFLDLARTMDVSA